MSHPQLMPPPDRVRPLIGNPFLLLPDRRRRAPSWFNDPTDPATRLLYRVAIKPFGQPFDLAQWALWLCIAGYIFTDPTVPKVSPMAVLAFSWFYARMGTGAIVLTLRGLWRILKAVGRLLAPVRPDY
jgi:phytoene dehydrogenase-like protein